MKIIRYQQGDETHYGVLEGNDVRRIQGSIYGSYQIEGQRLPLEQVRLLAPIVPNKIVAIGLNYKKHAEEMNKPLPEEPMMFLVSTTAVIAHQDKIQLQYPDHHIEHEGELAIVIGKTADRVDEADALQYVLGYTCCNDISDRTLQKRDGQFTRAKSFATYKPIGPVIATDIEPDRAAIRVTVNGKVRQDSNTSDMIFNTAKIISFVSRVMRLEPGDVILTGTPSGVSPLQAGDVVEVSIEGIGNLTNAVMV
jgi:2-keto-4-pentenoate hydratase/2-oxohepta-3-ene-1,7-dioic acid hydratase in catechol pathway